MHNDENCDEVTTTTPKQVCTKLGPGELRQDENRTTFAISEYTKLTDDDSFMSENLLNL
jgi:hypothetical protein